MSMDEPSLSDHEQRILEEIERNLTQEDPDFVRNVSEVRSPKRSSLILKLSVLGFIVGFGFLLGYTSHLLFGVVGFVVMLGSVVGLAMSVRDLSASGRNPSAVLRDALRRAEDRMRPRRREP